MTSKIDLTELWTRDVNQRRDLWSKRAKTDETRKTPLTEVTLF